MSIRNLGTNNIEAFETCKLYPLITLNERIENPTIIPLEEVEIETRNIGVKINIPNKYISEIRDKRNLKFNSHEIVLERFGGSFSTQKIDPKSIRKRFNHYKTSYGRPTKEIFKYSSDWSFQVFPNITIWKLSFKTGYHKCISFSWFYDTYTFRWTKEILRNEAYN